jgi:4-hydroxythreonine-4-phosphate dehydrogenase
MKARIAMVLGDPAGIGPELVAKLLADAETRKRADILLIADRDEIDHGCGVAGVRYPYQPIGSVSEFRAGVDEVQHYPFRGQASPPFARAEATANGGRYSLDTLDVALDATTSGITDAVVFGPLNKTSLHLAGMAHSDELHWFAERLGYTGPFCEFNVMDRLWTSRVTSHVALKDVPRLITRQGVVEAVELIDTALRRSGVEEPRIAVCGLNPHLGDHGNFGREEIDTIGPAVEQAQAKGLPALGPFPADTIFIKARDGEFDAVVTMYHDQGQIAIKLLGFQRGVTVQGGLPIPITTPAHGTAFDIAGKGKAHPGAMRQAFDMACRMAESRRQASTRQSI